MERVQFIFFITDEYKENFSILTEGEGKKKAHQATLSMDLSRQEY